jgi:hypothetical protein
MPRCAASGRSTPSRWWPRGGSGTVRDAIERYLGSTTFRGNAQSTQDLRRPILNGFLKPGVGNLPLAKMDRRYIERWLETASTIGAKRTWLLAVRPFMQWAVEPMHLIETDPTEGIKVKIKDSDGHPTWTDEQIAQFRNYYPLGTKARLALELLLGVTLRRGDGISLGRQHVKDGWLVYTQEKNRKRKPVKVETPLPTEIVAAIEACPAPPRVADVLNRRARPPVQQADFQSLVPRADRRRRIAGYLRAARAAQGRWMHHGRERVHAARNHVGDGPFLPQRS